MPDRRGGLDASRIQGQRLGVKSCNPASYVVRTCHGRLTTRANTLRDQSKPRHTVAVHGAHQLAHRRQRVQLRDRLAHCNRQLMHVQRTREQHRQQRRCAMGCRRTGRMHIGKVVVVVLRQRRNALLQARERLAV